MFLDIGLPVMNGYAVAERLRGDPEYKAVWLVALTGWGAEGDRQRAISAGFDFHLAKPVERNRVNEILAGFERARIPKA